MTEIPLSKKGKYAGKYVAIIDDCDADLLIFNWSFVKGNKTNYAFRKPIENGVRKKQAIHRVILERILNRELLRSEFVDHIDGNGLNNTRDNLRIATQSQNQMNRGKPKGGTSKYKGVSLNSQSGKWIAQIRVRGKQIYLGQAITEEGAYKIYCEKAPSYHGDYFNLG